MIQTASHSYGITEQYGGSTRTDIGKKGWECRLYILRGHMPGFPNYDVFLFL